ncbi:unnamed protein product [Ambrosiozyma monospora]|uniref:Unnamed protein product n=1 Tax=Ambrosiozyma monospora TaxID=43982 RepID=A0ACB5SSM8_AMBMO|nr:unnamed protein product [Ambrosiozyma monospora]
MAPIPVLLTSFLASIISSETRSYDDEYSTLTETESFVNEPIFTTCVGKSKLPIFSPAPTTVIDTIVATTTASVSISTFVPIATTTTTTEADDNAAVESSLNESNDGVFMNGLLRFLFGRQYEMEYQGCWTAGMNQLTGELTGTFDEDELMFQTMSELTSVTSDAIPIPFISNSMSSVTVTASVSNSVSISTFVPTATATTNGVAGALVDKPYDFANLVIESDKAAFMEGIMRFLFGRQYEMEYQGRWTAGLHQFTGELTDTFDEDDLMFETMSDLITTTSDATVTSTVSSTPSVPDSMPAKTI